MCAHLVPLLCTLPHGGRVVLLKYLPLVMPTVHSSIRLYVRLGTNGCHEIVPDEVYKEAEDSAKAALADSDDDEDEDL